MRVTSATFEDIPRLCELLALLFAQEAEFAPDAGKQAAGLRAVIYSPQVGLILVVKESDEIVGMVNLLFTVSTFLGAKVALLEDMMVHPGHRGKGIGTALLNAAIERAKAEGCARITLLTDADNAEAKAFYRRAGFVESTMTPMRLMLPLGD
jgi:GNAT superfamily N-acetyltransferase